MDQPAIQIPDSVRQLTSQPNWYDHLQQINDMLASANPNVQPAVVSELAFEQLLTQRALSLGEAGPNWDAERQPIDTIVLHHTGSNGPMRLSLLSVMHLLTLYVPLYQNPGVNTELIGGTPVYSGHAGPDGAQVFYGYHWLVRGDGKSERLLPDEVIGWHAGNWEVNCRSIAICFDADLENARPSPQAIHSAVDIIMRYAAVPLTRIVGHKQVVPTICPGQLFELWGEEIRALVEARRA